MIKTIRDKETAKVFSRQGSRKVPADIQQIAYRKLRYWNNARTLQDLRSPPANRLEKLKGDRVGQHSIQINDRWRICFRWQGNDAYDVEIVDYH